MILRNRGKQVCSLHFFTAKLASNCLCVFVPPALSAIQDSILLSGDRAGAKHALNELFARAERGLVAESLVDALLQMAGWLVEEEDLEDLLSHC